MLASHIIEFLQWGLLFAGCWLAWQLTRQNGRILLRLEALEQQLARPKPGAAAAPTAPTGLPVGELAPDFQLPDLVGGEKRLSEWRGRPVLLVFFDPKCGFCRQMAPALATLASNAVDGGPVPLVVSGRTAEENRELVREHGLRCTVLLQEGGEVAGRYQARGTPMGYLIDAQGRIAAELAVGAEALLALAGPRGRQAQRSLEQPGGRPQNGDGPAHSHGGNGYKGNRPLADSRLNRSGLAAGTPAPFFRLPRLDGGELGLEEYRGRRVLLVFSDTQCGPCDQLAPRLEQVGREQPAIQIVMVSRGEVERNRAKVAQFGLTFPVVLQRQWEVSKLYGMFGTPIAYLIDAEGAIAAEVAVGVEPILELLHAGGAASPAGNSPAPGAERAVKA